MKASPNQLEIIEGLLRTAYDLLCQYRKDYKGPQLRGKGICPYNGNEVHPMILIERGKWVRICNKPYSFTGAAQWAIVNRFFKSIKEGEDNTKNHFPVRFTTEDYNKCKLNCLALIKDFVERQPAAVRIRNTRYEDRARFKVELLK